MKGKNIARGGLACSVTSRATEGETVGIPRDSISRWTNAIDWWQIGHAGAAITMSGASLQTASAISRARVFANRWGAML